MEEMMNRDSFSASAEQILGSISPELLSDGMACRSGDEALYRYVQDYTCQKQLRNARVALPLTLWLLTNSASAEVSRFADVQTRLVYFQRSLSVCQMLIDLSVPLSHEDEDTLICATILHILPDVMRFQNLREELVGKYRFPDAVYKIVLLCYRENNLSDADKMLHFRKIQENPLALLLKLAARGNLIAQFYGIPVYNVRGYIYETRACYFPMCIYGKEHYPHLFAPISVLMEKMRCLMEVADILLARYERREVELTQQILQLQEENATIRGILKRMREEN